MSFCCEYTIASCCRIGTAVLVMILLLLYSDAIGSSAFDFHCRGGGGSYNRTTTCRGNGRSSLRGPVPRVAQRVCGFHSSRDNRIVYRYARRRRHPRTSPPPDSCPVQVSDRDFVNYFFYFTVRRPASRTRPTVIITRHHNILHFAFTIIIILLGIIIYGIIILY